MNYTSEKKNYMSYTKEGLKKQIHMVREGK